VLGQVDFSYGFRLFDLSHEELKQVIIWIKVFFTPYMQVLVP